MYNRNRMRSFNRWKNPQIHLWWMLGIDEVGRWQEMSRWLLWAPPISPSRLKLMCLISPLLLNRIRHGDAHPRPFHLTDRGGIFQRRAVWTGLSSCWQMAWVETYSPPEFHFILQALLRDCHLLLLFPVTKGIFLPSDTFNKVIKGMSLFHHWKWQKTET